jgi:acetyl/propionyl-CoA carboxylase alpha subunit
MYKAQVNGTHSFEINQKESQVNSQHVSFDCELLPDGTYHVLMDNSSMVAEVVSVDRNAKQVILRIDGKRFEVSLEDEFDQLLAKMGMDKSAAQKVSEVKSPMPGLVLEVKVNPGDEVSEGDPLMVLEAMKMENVIAAPCDAIVEQIDVSAQDKVEKNQVLVRFQG